MKYGNILETIGNTPHVKLNSLFGNNFEVWMKVESFNPAGSVKDRIAIKMVEEAEKQSLLAPNGTIVEPTSGNTGIGLALVAAVKGYRLILVMPDSMSVERRASMTAYGAELVLTPAKEGMKGAVQKAKELTEELGAWMPLQFSNPANPEAHRSTTAQEICADFTKVDYFFSGVGTGGQITGIGEVLKEKYPEVKIIAVEPDSSPVLSGGASGPHKIQGIGAGFVPDVLNTQIYGEVVRITNEEAYEYTGRVAKEEGILVGISTGATLAAIAKKSAEIPAGSVVLMVAYDTGGRYFSIEGLF